MLGAGAIYPIAVSIHAPAKGATSRSAVLGGVRDGFNPRPREGGDTRAMANHSARACFNPRPREGGDRIWRPQSLNALQFQSTPPRRGRRTV